MATIMIGYLPELTMERAMYLFGQRFAGTYDVRTTKVLKRDFVVRKSGWAGVGVRLKQEPGRTTFVFTGMMPNLLLQRIFGGLATYLFLRSTWREMEAEVADFIATCPEFQPRQETAAVPPPLRPTEPPPTLPALAGAPQAAQPSASKASGGKTSKPKTGKPRTSRPRTTRKKKAA